MSDNEVLDKLKHIIADDLDVNLKVEDIDADVPLFEEGLALDSVVLVELISFIEKRFGIELSDDALNMETFKNLASITRVIEKQMAQTSA